MIAKRVMAVFGTRPEAIKMMPVVKRLRQCDGFETIVAVTGQHRELLDRVFAVFDETPDIDLNLMTGDQSLGDLTAKIIVAMQAVLRDRNPDLVLVHGDTTTAFAAAVTAYYHRCKIGHVEAGLRTHDLGRPWPEEFNRVAVDALADYMFAPTQGAKENILREYNARGTILVTGNTGIDAVLHMADRIERDPVVQKELAGRHSYLDAARHLILVTGHRRESFGHGLEQICNGLVSISARQDVEVLYPVHLNPQVRSQVTEQLSHRQNIRLIDPVDYPDMVYLMKRARVIITDSGGMQEEGAALGRPVLVTRDVTERPEALATGVVQLIGTDPARIKAKIDALIDDPAEFEARARPVFPYGDGQASARIAEFIRKEILA